MTVQQIKKPRLFDAVFSIMVDPKGTTHQLFRYSWYPQWMLSVLLLFLTICITAPLMYSPGKITSPPHAEYLKPILLTTVLTLLIATLFVTMELRSLRVRKPWYMVLAALVYSTAPLLSTVSVLLIVDKIISGELTVIGFISTGYASASDICSRIYPIIIRIAITMCFVVLSFALREVSQSSIGLAALAAASAVPLVLGSFIMALHATEAVFPESSPTIISFFAAYMAYPP